MHAFLTILTGLAFLAVLAVLITGTITMARGTNPRRSNKLMQWRIVLQASALLLFMLLMAALRS
jgi:hypothetical protein